MTEHEELLHLYTVIDQVKIAFPWMLTDIKRRSDDGGIGESPELKHAISTKELLDMID